MSGGASLLRRARNDERRGARARQATRPKAVHGQCYTRAAKGKRRGAGSVARASPFAGRAGERLRRPHAAKHGARCRARTRTPGVRRAQRRAAALGGERRQPRGKRTEFERAASECSLRGQNGRTDARRAAHLQRQPRLSARHARHCAASGVKAPEAYAPCLGRQAGRRRARGRGETCARAAARAVRATRSARSRKAASTHPEGD